MASCADLGVVAVVVLVLVVVLIGAGAGNFRAALFRGCLSIGGELAPRFPFRLGCENPSEKGAMGSLLENRNWLDDGTAGAAGTVVR